MILRTVEGEAEEVDVPEQAVEEGAQAWEQFPERVPEIMRRAALTL